MLLLHLLKKPDTHTNTFPACRLHQNCSVALLRNNILYRQILNATNQCPNEFRSWSNVIIYSWELVKNTPLHYTTLETPGVFSIQAFSAARSPSTFQPLLGAQLRTLRNCGILLIFNSCEVFFFSSQLGYVEVSSERQLSSTAIACRSHCLLPSRWNSWLVLEKRKWSTSFIQCKWEYRIYETFLKIRGFFQFSKMQFKKKITSKNGL